MEHSEILTNVGVLCAGIIAGLIAYFGKKPSTPSASGDPVITGVGIELGNRYQIEQTNNELKRIADSLAIIADRRQATTEAKLDRILQELDEAEDRDRQGGAKPTRVRRSPRTPR